MKKEEIDKIINSLTQVKSNRDYWFVRTQGGSYYNDFINGEYIAIGYDEINLIDLKSANTDDAGRKILTEIIRKKFPEEGRPGFISQQLIDFTYNIKKGDIVVVPSSSSEYISIGEVLATPVFQAEKLNFEEECPFLKRKKVRWLKKDLLLDELDPEFIGLKYAQRTVTKINGDLTSYLDRIITPLFIKENDAHLSLDIRKADNINAYELFQTWSELLELSEEFGIENDLDIDKKGFDLKINVQSPGTIEFITYSVVGLVVLSVIIVAVVGAEFQSNTRPIRFSIKSEGLIKKVTDFLNSKKDRVLKTELIKKVKDMDINPTEIANILEKMNNDNRQN